MRGEPDAVAGFGKSADFCSDQMAWYLHFIADFAQLKLERNVISLCKNWSTGVQGSATGHL